MKLFKIFVLLAVFCISLIFGVSRVSAACLTGVNIRGICCPSNGFHCSIIYPDGSEGDGDVAFCNNFSNMGKECTYNLIRGTCQCTMNYTRDCNSSCVSNACATGDYLIEDTCAVDPGCIPVDGGWGEWSTCYLNLSYVCIKDRYCDDPEPNDCGDDCVGDDWAD